MTRKVAVTTMLAVTSAITGAWTKGALKEHTDPFGKEVFDEDVSIDNHGSPKLELNGAASWMTRITGGSKEFLELERNSPDEY